MSGVAGAHAVWIAAERLRDGGSLIILDGPRLLQPDGSVLVELAPDGAWRASDGSTVHGVELAAAQPAGAPRSGPPRGPAQEHSDAVWMTEASTVIARLAEQLPQLTSDDVWAALEKPPRESRMIGNALSRARSCRLIAPTKEHRRSTRRENHGRPVRVWASLRYGQQSL
jgi:hypothetical protein